MRLLGALQTWRSFVNGEYAQNRNDATTWICITIDWFPISDGSA